jgi:predicted metal-binding protein
MTWESDMKRIAIYVCGEISKKCTANGCLRAFNEEKEAFERYKEDGAKLVSFNSCNGCDQDPVGSLNLKIEKFLNAEVDTVHLSTCIRGRCDHYETFAHKLSEEFDVIGYTHGSPNGKKKDNNINILRDED